MTVLLHLTEPRAQKLASRLGAGRKFTVGVPDRAVRLAKRWRLCLILAQHPITFGDGEAAVDGEVPGGPFVVALARVRASPRSTTTDERLMVQRPHVLYDGLAVSEVFKAVPAEHRRSVPTIVDAVATDLGESSTAVFRAALDQMRPGLANYVDELLPGDDQPSIDGVAGENLALERDAVRLALNIAGLDVDLDSDWVGEGSNYLASLAYEPREDVMAAFDASRFPDFVPLPGGRPDWMTFTDGERHLRIANVDSTSLETRLGVDLIYRHVEADTFVLVQYKRMIKEGGDWWYRPDPQLGKELAQMRLVDSESDPGRGPVPPASWRLHPRACFVKLVAPPKTFDPTSDRLLSGIYLPLAYLEELLVHESTLGPKGGRRLGYSNVDRYMTTGLFTTLVREGWVGSRGITTKAIRALVEASLERDRSVVLAEETGHVSGAVRRAGPRR